MALRRLRGLALGLMLAVGLVSVPPLEAATSADRPSFRHGLGQVFGGLLLEFPKTVIEATFSNPPVVGTAVGVLAGAVRALQTTAHGLYEMTAGFNPWGTKR